MWERRREEDRKRAMEERKCFVCGGFRHIAHHCRNIEKERSVQMLLNRFEVMKNRVMHKGKGSGREAVKERKEVLREKRAKRGVEV